jgi:hypothetical protein
MSIAFEYTEKIKPPRREDHQGFFLGRQEVFGEWNERV